ncbi:hypothetical protein KL909_003369 [Ogataea angusta]|nr:hypothetical protein KL909_003369 [Ogataea angusta]
MENKRSALSLPEPALSLISGGIAGALSRTAVSPVERVKVLQQVQGSTNSYQGVFRSVLQIWREEGYRGLRQPQHRKQTGGRDRCRIFVRFGVLSNGSGENAAFCADGAAQEPQEPGTDREAAGDVAESREYLSQRGRHTCALPGNYADLVGRGAVHGSQLHDVREHEGAGARETPQKPSSRAHPWGHQRRRGADDNLSDGRFASAVSGGDASGRRNGVPVQVDAGRAGANRAQGRVQGAVQGTAGEHLEDMSVDGCAVDELRSDKKFASVVGEKEIQANGPASSV